MGVDTGWTLPPSCPSSGVGNAGPSSPQGPNTILVCIAKDVLWSLLQGPKKTGEEGGGEKQLLKLFCLHSIGQTQAYGHSCPQQGAEKCGLRVGKRSCAQLKPTGPRENWNRYQGGPLAAVSAQSRSSFCMTSPCPWHVQGSHTWTEG